MQTPIKYDRPPRMEAILGFYARLVLSLAGLFLIFGQINAQTIIVSPLLGPEIDRQEKADYRLFSKIPDRDFEQARFFLDEENQTQVAITLSSGKEIQRLASPDEIKEVRRVVESRNAELVGLLYNLSAKAEKGEKVENVRIGLENQDRYSGTMLSMNQESLLLDTGYGHIGIKIEEITFLQLGDLRQAGEQKRRRVPNSMPYKYLIGPTHIPLEKNSFYYQSIMVFYNSLHYGVTSNLTVGLGFEAISTLNGNPIIVPDIKVSFPVNSFLHLGAGAQGFFAFDVNSLIAGIPYFGATLGNREHNVTVNAGWGLNNEGLAQFPSFMVAGQTRIGRYWMVVSENYLITQRGGSFVMFNAGLRQLIGRRASFDYTFFVIPELWIDLPLPIPAVDFSYRF